MVIVRGFESAVLVAGVVLALSLAATGPVRRELRNTPLLTLFALAGAVACGLAVMAIFGWPTVLHGTSLTVAVIVAGAWWRARPTYGNGRSLPPGSLAIHESIRAIDDRNYYLDRAARYGPIFKMSQFGRPVVCVLGLGRARRLLQDESESLGPAALSYNALFPKGTLRYMNEQDHRNEMPLFRAAFATLDLQPNEQAIRNMCRQTLRALSIGSANNAAGVAPNPFLERWVERSLACVFFGVEPNSEQAARLVALQSQVALNHRTGLRWRSRTTKVFSEAIHELKAVGSKSAGDGAVSSASALGDLLKRDPFFLDDANRAQNLFLGYRLAIKDVNGLLQWILSMLTENPHWQDRMAAAEASRDNSFRSQPRDLGGRIVFETLRMHQSEYLYRRLTKPLAIDGFQIPAGWLLRICVHESHRDSAIFAEPNRFNPDRFADATFGRNEYSPFGADSRACIGVGVVHVLGRIFVEELCGAYSWRLLRDGPPKHGTRHHDHWHPNPNRRFVFTEKPPS